MLFGIFFGPYLLLGLIFVFALFYWAMLAEGREDKRSWGLFGMRTSEDYRKVYGDRPPY